MTPDKPGRRISPAGRTFAVGALTAVLAAMVVTLVPAGAQPTPPPPTEPRRWTVLDTGTTANLTAVSFSEPLAGHVVGAGGTILATTDGGTTWNAQAACTKGKGCGADSKDRISADLTGVGFWDVEHGVAVGAGGTILSTDDGGKTWTPRPACEPSQPCDGNSPDRTTVDLTAVSVVRPSHAYAVGKGGTMLASDDHGRSWRRLAICSVDTPTGGACDAASGQPDLAAVTATSARVFQVSGADGTVVTTRNGGKSFHPVPICISDPALFEQSLRDNQERTRRQLEGLPALPPPQPRDADVAACLQHSATRRIRPGVAGIAFADPRRPGQDPQIYATGEPGSLLTTSGGRWDVVFACAGTQACAESSPDRVRSELRAVTFSHDLAGYAVGAGGVIVSLKRMTPPARNQAATPAPDAPLVQWRPEASGTTNDLNGVSFPTPGVGYAVGNGGTVVKLDATSPGSQVAGINPTSGPTVGRSKVKISGKGFDGATDVYFGAIRADRLTVDSDRAITATAPPGSAGTVHVTVSTPGGPSSAAPAGRFTYVAPEGGRWEPGASCTSGCTGPSVVLGDGKILAAGGVDRGTLGGSATTHVYEPSTRAWSSSGPLAQPRAKHTVTALGEGRALAVGGVPAVRPPGSDRSDYSIQRSTEIYDPAARQWSAAADLEVGRADHAATLLGDGRVLVTGGLVGIEGGSSAAETWDPGAGIWSATGSMAVPRFHHSATLLHDGTVLVVGGCSAGCSGLSPSAETYEGASGRWRSVASPKHPHAAHTATLLPNGEVLVAGGTGERENATPFAERYDPTTDKWTAAAPMHVPRALHSATALEDGRVLVAGGVSDDPASEEDLQRSEPVQSAEIYDPTSDRWALVSDMPAPRALHGAWLLRSGCGDDCGKVLVSGGEDPLEVPVLYTAAPSTEAGTTPGAGMSTGRILLMIGAILIGLTVLALARRAGRR